MIGFQNANYWASAFDKSPAMDRFPHAALCRAITELASKNDEYANHAAVQKWCAKHGFHDSNSSSQGQNYFDPRAVHELCAVLRQKGSDPILQSFAEKVATTEVRIVLEHAMERAGLEMPSTKAN